MITAFSGSRTRRFGISVAGAVAAMVLAAPIANAGASLTVSSDNGRHYLGHTYTLTFTVDPPKAGTVTFCAAAGGIMTCYPAIDTPSGTASRSWTPTKLAIYEITAKLKHATGTRGANATVYVRS